MDISIQKYEVTGWSTDPYATRGRLHISTVGEVTLADATDGDLRAAAHDAALEDTVGPRERAICAEMARRWKAGGTAPRAQDAGAAVGDARVIAVAAGEDPTVVARRCRAAGRRAYTAHPRAAANQPDGHWWSCVPFDRPAVEARDAATREAAWAESDRLLASL